MYVLRNGREISALRRGRMLNSHSAASITQRKPFQTLKAAMPYTGGMKVYAASSTVNTSVNAMSGSRLYAMKTTAPMKINVKPVPTFATYVAAAIRVRMTSNASSMGGPSFRGRETIVQFPFRFACARLTLCQAFEAAAVRDDRIADHAQERADSRGVLEVLVRDDPQLARKIGQHARNAAHAIVPVAEIAGQQRNADA